MRAFTGRFGRTMWQRVVVTALLLLVVSACSSGDGFATLNADDSFPSDSLSDWVSYAQQISMVTVVSDRELPMPEAERERGDGYQGRIATLRVDQTLWHAPNYTPQSTVDIVVAGWVVKDNRRQEAAVDGGPRIEVGDQFLLPITQYEDGSFTLLSSHALIPLAGKPRGLASEAVDTAAKQLKGLSTEQMISTLASTSPDPLAAKYASLPPYERARKVIDERAAAQATN